MRWRGAFLVFVGFASTGCVTSFSLVNHSIRSCNDGRLGGCQSHADDLVGDSLIAKISDEGRTLPRDRATAKKLYAWECRAGNGHACRSIVEKRLAASPEEKEHYAYLAEYYGTPVRSPEAVRAEKALTNKEAIAFNKQEEEVRERREEQSRENWRQTMGMAGQALSDWNKEIQAKYGGAPAVPSGGESSPSNVWTPQGGNIAVVKDACARCKPHVDRMSRACGLSATSSRGAQEQSHSPDCYRASAAMHHCTWAEAPGCSKNVKWSQEEEKRMDRAATEIERR